MFNFDETQTQSLVQDNHSSTTYTRMDVESLGGGDSPAHQAPASGLKSTVDRQDSMVLSINDILSGDSIDFLLSGPTTSSGYQNFFGTDSDDVLEGNHHETLSGGTGDDVLNTKDGNGFNSLNGGEGNDEIDGNHHDKLIGGAGDDQLSTDEGNGYNVLIGGDGNDELSGNHHDTLSGGVGDDIITTKDGKGNNTLHGGAGNDELEGNHHDTLSGGVGDDDLSTADGNGYNTLNGGAGNDVLKGGHHDTLYGGAGDDVIELYGGFNTVYGNKGADTFEIADTELPSGVNTIKDFKPGEDKISIRLIEGLESFSDLTLKQVGRSVVVSFHDQDIAILEKTTIGKISADDFMIEPIYATDISAADFDGSPVNNTYLPLIPGTKWIYEGMTPDGPERVEVEVLTSTRTIMGIVATAVRDTVYLNGQLKEDTFDWFAQDKDGNVWYLGEDVSDYENGVVVSKAGSFEFGVDGALPGIAMHANPAAQIGTAYNLEFYQGEAEDQARVLSTTESLSLPVGTFTNVVKTFDFTPLDHRSLEEKYFAPGVGMVRSVNLTTGVEIRLVQFTPGSV